jgi:hypothetical protein
VQGWRVQSQGAGKLEGASWSISKPIGQPKLRRDVHDIRDRAGCPHLYQLHMRWKAWSGCLNRIRHEKLRV